LDVATVGILETSKALCDYQHYKLAICDKNMMKPADPDISQLRTPSPDQTGAAAMAKSVYDFSAATIGGKDQPLADYKGKAMLIVNTASKCGFTPQFEGLENIHKKFADKGLAVLGFPCNQFGHQDPGSNGDIESFCQLNYGVSFPMYAKIDVNGPGTHPLFNHLKSEAPGILGSKRIKWNFTKFLVDKSGKVVKRYPPLARPEDIEKDIAALL
jgi:glutathione peroxidase